MKHIEPLSVTCLKAWLDWDSMLNLAWLENFVLDTVPSVFGFRSPRDWQELLRDAQRKELRDPKRLIVKYMLRRHLERLPPMIILTKEESRVWLASYQSAKNARPGAGEHAPARN